MRTRQPLALLASLLFATGCQVGPPRAAFETPQGLVRAEAPERAQRVGALLGHLEPEVRALLPDTRERDLEVWVQTRPALYTFDGEAYAEADGFWSESHGRIHLRDGSGHLRRTLAHELVHASLGPSWERLPGSIEEGLCDLVSVHLAPSESVDMRAGRLSAAAFAMGGLELDVEIALSTPELREASRLGAVTRLRLYGEVSEHIVPEDIFEVSAGLSSTRLATNDKKALYGLSFLLVERIVERRGFEGLHALCSRAAVEGLDEVPRAWLLEAAGLVDTRRGTWRAAIHGALGDAELRTILLLYPEALLGTARRLFGPQSRVAVDLTGASPLRARVALPWSTAEVELGLLAEAPPVLAAAR